MSEDSRPATDESPPQSSGASERQASQPLHHSDVPAGPEDPSKRKFIANATHALGACVTCAIAVPALGMVAHPLLADSDGTEAGGDGYVRIASIGRFKVAAPAARVVVKADRKDAWVTTNGVPVGSILVKRTADDKFLVFSAKCPHLGCSVNPVVGEDRFQCPCHNSSFSADGSLQEQQGHTNPAPRGLDKLDWRIEGGELHVRYVSYKTGTKEQVSIG